MTIYQELHCHSNFSLLDGAAHPEQLVARAAELGMTALALTDHDAVYGAVRFVRATQSHGIRPILGAEMTLEDGYHLTLLVTSERGWHRLCRLISRARHNAPKGEAALPLAALEGDNRGLLALSGCRRGTIATALRRGERRLALEEAGRLRDRFAPGAFWIELQHHLRPEDDGLVADLVALAGRLELNYVATNNVHYATREGYRLQDLLVAIRHNRTLEEAARRLRPNSEFYLKSGAEMARLFGELPEALANSCRVAERCRFEWQAARQPLPAFPTPRGMAARQYLRWLCERALRERYGEVPARARRQMEHELGVIEQSDLANYFLVVWDIVRFARERRILCQGRGSAINSLVAYLLGISPIDPLDQDLVFERFLSAERRNMPDIDIDFQADRREEVIQYLYERYGHEHVAMACTVTTFQARSALRDAGKALGFPPAILNRVARELEGHDAEALGRYLRAQGTPAIEGPWQQLAELCAQLDGFPRHLGIHNGGMVVTGQPLATRVPTEPATMAGRTVVQWDKDNLEEAGLIKIDILGLRMLSAIAEAVAIIEAQSGRRPALDRLTFDDPAIYRMITRADTIGLFQVESRAQAQILPRLQPRCFNDLIISISLIRPGPLQGEMVHPFLRRRQGEEPVSYAHPSLIPALGETLGVILFQEQVLKVARDLAGFTAGQGELLRRALGKKRATAEVERFRAAFLRGARERGVDREAAEGLFEQLKAFGGYAFAKSHAAAFAVLVYRSAWLKHYHPAPFFAALLNQQPMGFWSPAVLVNDAKRHGVQILPVDINRSGATCTVRENAIRMGLTYVLGLGEAGAGRIIRARQDRSFTSLQDFCRRTRLPRRLVEHLILAGAMDGWKTSRRQLLWELGTLHYREEELEIRFPVEAVDLPPLTALETLCYEEEMIGIATSDHLLALYRAWLKEQGVIDSRRLEHCPAGRPVRAAGQVVMHQAPPTARGVHFLTLEDEYGLINVIVRPEIYRQYRPVIRNAPLLVVGGAVQRRGGVTNLIADHVTSLAEE